MEKDYMTIEGIVIEIDMTDESDKEAQKKRFAQAFQKIRELSGMSRKDFGEWLGIPYRTMREWELGRRAMPEYVLRLIAYKVINEKRKGDEANA